MPTPTQIYDSAIFAFKKRVKDFSLDRVLVNASTVIVTIIPSDGISFSDCENPSEMIIETTSASGWFNVTVYDNTTNPHTSHLCGRFSNTLQLVHNILNIVITNQNTISKPNELKMHFYETLQRVDTFLRL